jgi:hypothetical protein
MQCPACGTHRAHTIVTMPSDRREDGRVYRRKRCVNPKCRKEFTSFEMLVSEVQALERQSAPAGGWSKPLPTTQPGPLIDIEGSLEGLLKPSLEYIQTVLGSVDPSDRGKIDLARWLIDDRREYRKSLAEAHGEGAEDPAVQELAKVLALVPPPAEESA